MTTLSVITVVKDDDTGFVRTTESMAIQDPADIEWLIVDSSADQASVPSIINSHRLSASTAWSAPAGVYPAMNAGLARARGRYVYFLNAGDRLIHGSVLSDIVCRLQRSSPVWGYGRVRFLMPDGGTVAEPSWDYRSEQNRCFARGRFPSHQGVVMSTEELRRQGGFDTRFRVVADYASILKASVAADPDVWDLEVAEFSTGGLSTQQWRLAQEEFHRARREILRPTGWAAAMEALDTTRSSVATRAYRTLWAPGRPLHSAVARARRSAG